MTSAPLGPRSHRAHRQRCCSFNADKGISKKRWIVASLLVLGAASSAGAGATWLRSYGGPAAESGGAFEWTPDGGFVAATTTESFGALGKDFWVFRTDAAGDVTWAKRLASSYLGDTGLDDVANAIAATPDGGLAVTGTTDGHLRVFKLDGAGSVLWGNVYAVEGTRSVGRSIRPTADGGLLVIGSTERSATDPKLDLWLLKLDSAGSILWQKTYGDSEDDEGHSVWELRDGTIFAAGVVRNPFADERMGWVLHLDPGGEVIVQYGDARFTGSTASFPRKDGSVAVVGTLDDSRTGLVRLRFLLWKDAPSALVPYEYDDPVLPQVPNAVVEMEDGDLVVVGSPGFVVRLHEGMTVWAKRLPDATFQSVTTTADGDLRLGGFAPSMPSGSADVIELRVHPGGDGCPSLAEEDLPSRAHARPPDLVPVTPVASSAVDLGYELLVFDAIGVTEISCEEGCRIPPPEILGVKAVRSGPDVLLSWLPDATATASNVWYVADKRDIDRARLASAPPAQGVVGCAPPAPATSGACDDAGAVPRGAPGISFYQVRASCDPSSEGL